MGREGASVNLAVANVQLQTAAAESLALIDRHRAQAHWRSKALFEKLADPKVLFDIELTYPALLESANIQGDRTMAMIQFHKDSGQSLWEYGTLVRVARAPRLGVHVPRIHRRRVITPIRCFAGSPASSCRRFRSSAVMRSSADQYSQAARNSGAGWRPVRTHRHEQKKL
jgi:hypothetical protein